MKEIDRTLREVSDPNEQISYLRAGLIGKLSRECSAVFEHHHAEILNGAFHSTLLKSVDPRLTEAMDRIREVSFKEIYNHRTVVEIEIAGYKILGTLLEEFTGALLNPHNPLSQKILKLIPAQYEQETGSTYHLIQSVVDFISGMTDVYALDLYRKIKGISLPELGS